MGRRASGRGTPTLRPRSPFASPPVPGSALVIWCARPGSRRRSACRRASRFEARRLRVRPARRLGATILEGSARTLVQAGLGLLVIDDPSGRAALPWLRAARRAGIPVASIHDVGVAPLATDLAVDGSLGARRVGGLGIAAGACRLGPAYAVLSPDLPSRRTSRAPAVRRQATLVVGLGGGRQAAAGVSIVRHLAERASCASWAGSGTRLAQSGAGFAGERWAAGRCPPEPSCCAPRAVSGRPGAGHRRGRRRRDDALRGVCARDAGGRGAGGAGAGDDRPPFRAGRAGRRRPATARGRRRLRPLGPGDRGRGARPAGGCGSPGHAERPRAAG